MKVLTPKTLPLFTSLGHLPWFFIGGPVIGGGDWQVPMILELNGRLEEDFVAISPCRWEADHVLAPYFVQGPRMKARQTDWERRDLVNAALLMPRGCIIIYLAEQVEPRPPEMGVYARDSLGEIGEWRGRMMSDPSIRFVLGADPEFDPNGVSVMKRNFDEALGYDFPIYSSIAATAKAAVARAME